MKKILPSFKYKLNYQQIQSIMLELNYPSLIGKILPISELVCSNVKNLDPRNLSVNPNPCTNYGQRIANSLIKVAATRIFSNPTQSIIELPVNSIDSYNNQNAIGKFGMGFFSILYWLIDHPQRYLTIESCHAGQRFLIKIFSQGDERLYFEFMGIEKYETSYTAIKLHVENDLFQEEIIDGFIDQINRINTVESVKIEVNHQLINRSDSSNLIRIILRPDLISVEDFAKGISIDVLFSSLLTPSISTKGIKSLTFEASPINKTNIYTAFDKSYFRILVGDYAVVSISLPSIRHYYYDLHMPLTTPLPVSRDDILIEDLRYREYFAYYINILINKANTILHSLVDLFRLFELYILYSGQREITNVLTKSMKDFMELDLNFLPGKYTTEEINNKHSLAIFLSQKYPELHFVEVENCPVSRAQANLIRLIPGFSDKIFSGRYVKAYDELPTDYITGGLPGILLIKTAILNDSNQISNLSMVFAEGKLLIPKSIVANDIKLIVLRILENSGILSESGQRVIPFETWIKIGTSTGEQPKSRLQILLEENSESFDQEIIRIIPFWEEIISFAVIVMDFYDSYGDGGLIGSYRGGFTDNIDKTYGRLGGFLGLFINAKCLNKENLNKYCGFFGTRRPSVTYGNRSRIFLYNFFNLEIVGLLYIKDEQFPQVPFLKLNKRKSEIYESYISRDYLQMMINFNQEMLDFYYEYLLDVEYLEKFEFDIGYFFQGSAIFQRFFKITDDGDNQIMMSSGIAFERHKIMMLIEMTRIKPFVYKLIFLGLMNILFNLQEYISPGIFNRKFVDFIYLSIQKRYSIKYATETFFDNYIYRAQNVRIIPTKGIFYTKIYLNLLMDCRNYINTQNDFLQRINNFNFLGEDYYQFTAKQLINTIFNKNDIQGMNWLTDVSKENSETKLQVIDIAVNVGTSKDFIMAVMTELTQNSIDAMNKLSPEDNVDKSIRVSIGLNDNRSLILEFWDPVGIPDPGILSILIPFLSTKSAQELLNAGEMGSGFFNTYRQPWVKNVIIETDNLTRSIKILATPLVDPSDTNRVVDINYELRIGESSGNRGTKISLIFNNLSQDMKTELISNTIFFTRDFISQQEIDVYMNGELIKWPKTLIYEEEGVTFHSAGLGTFVSILNTSGIPFNYLDSYLTNMQICPKIKDLVSTGIVVNLPKSLYKPVQSRNRLNIDKKNLKKIVAILYRGIYWCAVNYCLENNNYAIQLIPNYLSKADPSQILPRYRNEKKFLCEIDFILGFSFPLQLKIKRSSITISDYIEFDSWIREINLVVGRNSYRDSKLFIHLKEDAIITRLLRENIEFVNNFSTYFFYIDAILPLDEFIKEDGKDYTLYQKECITKILSFNGSTLKVIRFILQTMGDLCTPENIERFIYEFFRKFYPTISSIIPDFYQTTIKDIPNTIIQGAKLKYRNDCSEAIIKQSYCLNYDFKLSDDDDDEYLSYMRYSLEDLFLKVKIEMISGKYTVDDSFQKGIDSIKNSQFATYDPNLLEIVSRWFSIKQEKKEKTGEDVEIGVGITNDENTQREIFFGKFLEFFINQFWVIGSQLEREQIILGSNFHLHPEPPQLKYFREGPILGQYISYEHTIRLNLGIIDWKLMVDEIIKLKQIFISTPDQFGMYFRESKTLKDLIGIKGIASGVLIHELGTCLEE